MTKEGAVALLERLIRKIGAVINPCRVAVGPASSGGTAVRVATDGTLILPRDTKIATLFGSAIWGGYGTGSLSPSIATSCIALASNSRRRPVRLSAAGSRRRRPGASC